ncbi:hypothetical protein ACFQ6C_26450 [Streptomyces sp. NPDC056454]|uniref:hypothetical protein n=1 Tax=Streptomyces sp. NPDC056454 TaxID=3345823 RepID=UPI0036CBCCBD
MHLISFDDGSVTVGIIPQTCGACGARVDQVRMALDVVAGGTSDFLGIRTVATTPCCGGQRNAHYPVELLARLLDHLQSYPNHQNAET